MLRRMMCTQCFETAEPETVLEGSDLAEMLSWLCFAVPGWLYCLWRHALRSKVCPTCGSESLIRESRAAQRRTAARSAAPLIRSASGPIRWPLAFASPRERLLHGGITTALIGSVGLGCLFTGPGLNAPGMLSADSVTALSVGLCAGWLIFEIGRLIRTRAPSCSAWDESGRELQIEVA
jgi:hypothetical protein